MRPYPQVLTTDDEDLDPSIEATLPVILRLMHAAAIDTNGRFDAAAAELDEHDEDEEEEDDDGDVDDVVGGRGRKSRKRKQRKAIAAVEKTSTALSTHLAKAMAQLLQRFGTHAGPLRAVLCMQVLTTAPAPLSPQLPRLARRGRHVSHWGRPSAVGVHNPRTRQRASVPGSDGSCAQDASRARDAHE